MKTKALIAVVAFAALSSMTFAQVQPQTSTTPAKEKTTMVKTKDANKHAKKTTEAAKKAETGQKTPTSK